MNYIEYEPKMWDNLGPNFMDHLDQVNADLKAASLPLLGITQEYWLKIFAILIPLKTGTVPLPKYCPGTHLFVIYFFLINM